MGVAGEHEVEGILAVEVDVIRAMGEEYVAGVRGEGGKGGGEGGGAFLRRAVFAQAAEVHPSPRGVQRQHAVLQYSYAVTFDRLQHVFKVRPPAVVVAGDVVGGDAGAGKGLEEGQGIFQWRYVVYDVAAQEDDVRALVEHEVEKLAVAFAVDGAVQVGEQDEAQARVLGELVRLQAVKAQRQAAPEGADEQQRAKADAEQGDPQTSFHLLLLRARRTPPDAAAYDAGKQG